MTATHNAVAGGVLEQHPAAEMLPIPISEHDDAILLSKAPPIHAPSRFVRAAVSVGYGVAGFLVLGLAWQIAHTVTPALASPLDTLATLRMLLGEAFAPDGPAGQGVGLQLRDSLVRVFKGFAMAAGFGVPFGFLIGRSKVAWRMFNPVIQLLRPVSPMAWFPIWLAVMTKMEPAAIWTIFVTSMMPVIVNTAAGAASVPTDQHDVARVFKFSKLTELREVVVPHAVPSVITGLRLSMGIAWLVIVASEMLSASSGIGFFVWQSYNGPGLTHVMSAVIIIGAVGLALDTVFVSLGRRLSGEGTR
jgi:nitrate/nitrite transport system permease protein